MLAYWMALVAGADLSGLRFACREEILRRFSLGVSVGLLAFAPKMPHSDIAKNDEPVPLPKPKMKLEQRMSEAVRARGYSLETERGGGVRRRRCIHQPNGCREARTATLGLRRSAAFTPTGFHQSR